MNSLTFDKRLNKSLSEAFGPTDYSLKLSGVPGAEGTKRGRKKPVAPPDTKISQAQNTSLDVEKMHIETAIGLIRSAMKCVSSYRFENKEEVDRLIDKVCEIAAEMVKAGVPTPKVHA